MNDRESSLVTRLLSSSLKEKAFSELVDDYQENLYWYIRKIVITHENANDVLQNTFIRVYRNIKSFRGKSSLKTWMFRIAYNESIRYLETVRKKEGMHYEFDANSMKILIQDAYFDGDDIQLKLNEIISQLSEKQRQVFQMKYFDDLSFKEIAEIINIRENTLKSSYYSAVKIIEKKILDELQ